MQPAIPSVNLRCTQCGGELHPDEGQIFLTCPYCSATVYLDKSRVVFHWSLAPTLDENQARGSLMRWMAGNQTVKDLDRKARLVSQSFSYFPMWYFLRRQPNGIEEIQLEPAAATATTEVRNLKLPAGDLRPYDETLTPHAVEPTVPLATALEWAFPTGKFTNLVETAIVHIPLYTFKYTYLGNPYTALVEGATGATLANIFPEKAESPYRTIGGITAMVFLCLALIPVIGALTGSENGFFTSAAICIGLGVLVTPVLLAAAAWVAAKV